MQQKLRLLFFSLICFCGLSMVDQHAAYGQATAIIEDITNSCGTQNNGSFKITVTAGTGPFSVFVLSPATGYFVNIPVTLGVPELVGVPPPADDTGLPADNLVVSVFDNDPASNYSTNITILSIPEITGITTTDVSNSDNTCVTPNGSITIDAVTGGSGSFDFSWTGPNGFTANTQDITGLAGGDYVVTINDQTASCSFTSSAITLTDPVPNPFTISSPDLTPCSNGDFTVDLSLSDPGVEYRLYVDGSPTTTTVTGPTASIVHTGLSPGSHSISVLATLGSCSPVFSSNTLAFDMNTPPASAVLSGNAVICEGASSNIAVTITGGTGPYSFTLDNGVGLINNYASGTAIPVSPAATTTYNIVGNVADANGCTVAGSGTATVTVDPSPTAVISGGGSVCVGSPFPTVTFTFTGTAPFDFTYTDGTTPVTITNHNALTFDINPPAGTYAVTALSDNKGCVGTDLGTPVMVIENPLPTATAAGGGTICSGSVLPDITFTFTGTAPFDFTYTDGTTSVPVNGHNATTYTLTNATAGTYSVTALTDANTCVATDFGSSASVIVNPLPTAAISGGGAVCAGSPLPTVTFTFTGTAPFDFTYTDGGMPVTITNHNALTFDIASAPAGTYSITALSDNNTCAATDLGTPVAVVQNPLPTATAGGGGTICSGSVLPDVTFTFTGTAPFDFTYTDGTTPVTVNGHNATTFTLANAPAGTYSVTALTDANTCVATDFGSSATVVVNPLPTAAISGGGSVCAGDPLPTITFTFTGTAPFDFSYTDGTTPVTINNHNATTFAILNAAAGTYTVTALNDNNGCIATDLGTPVAVVVNPRPTATAGGGGTVCSGSVLPDVTFTFTGTAPFDFTYTDGTTPVGVTGHNATTYTLVNAPAGTYSVTALTDANTCVATDFGSNAQVVVNPLPTAAISGGGAVCAGDAMPDVTFTFTGAIPFDFTYTDGTTPVTVSNNSLTFIIPGAAPGTYSITALADNNGCVGTDFGTPVAVVENPLPTATTTGGGTVCSGSVLPDVTFTFTGAAPFDFTYTDGTTPVTVSGHNAATFEIVNAVAGTYSVTALTDANGCTATSLGGTATVIVNPLPTASVSGGGSACAGSPLPTITFTFTGAIPFDFTYTDGAVPVTVTGHNALTFDITNAPAGTYSVTALSDNNACVATDFGTPVAVVENALPTATAGGGGTICSGSVLPDVTFTFTGTAPFDFTYTDGTTPVTVNGHNATTYTLTTVPEGTYSVTALTDANTCVATDFGSSANVIVNPLPTAAISGGGAVCAGSPLPTVTFTFTGTAPFDFTYTDGATPVTITGHNVLTFDITNAPAGTYFVSALSDNNTCVATDLGSPVAVVENPLPTATAGGGGTVCAGSVRPDVIFTFTGTAPFDFTYTDGTTAVTVNAHNGTTFTIVDPPVGTYTVTALSDINGCVATSFGASASVVEEPPATVEAGDAQMICTGNSTALAGSTVGGSVTTAAWSIVNQPAGGDGVLDNYSQTATPSAVTFTATIGGDYTLRLTTDDPAGVCEPLTDDVVITVITQATAEAGPAQTICQSGTVTLAGIFTGSTGITWTTLGDGSFDDDTKVDAVYTPGTNDISNSTVTLTITTAGPCVSVSDDVVITINPDPTVGAGSPQTICSTSTITLNGTFGGSATGLLWSTAGNGTFDDATDPFATYTLGADDISNGSVVLTATATGSCPGTFEDVTITVRPAAIIDAGISETICLGNTLTLDGTLGGSTTVFNWSTSGDGSFSNVNDPDAVYTPGTNDQASGTVTLTATSNNPPGPCAAVTDNIVITLINTPGDETTAGNETWIGYVYNDAGDPTPIPAKIDFATAKYSGFIDESDIAGMSAGSVYDVNTDEFDLNLGITVPLQGPRVCGNFLNNFSVRYKMDKTMNEGIYRFTVGGDDGVKLLIDGVNVISPSAFDFHPYTPYTSDPVVCLSAGMHTFEIQYFDNTGQSRLTFDYEAVSELTTTTPIAVCINSPAPTLTVSNPDAGVQDFNWYKGGTLVFTGASYTPSAADLDMTTAASVTFAVTSVFGCGESAPTDVTVNVLNSATLVMGPETVCESGGLVDLSSLVDASPPGGAFIFSGHPNISGNNFDPIGLAGSIISIAVDYSSGSCTAPQGTLELTVTNSAVITTPAAAVAICESSPDVDLTTLVSASPSGGTFVFSGPNVVGNVFDPTGLSGVQTITADYSIGGCVAPQTTFQVDVTTTASLTVTNTTACENGPSVNLLGLVSGSPSGGLFSFSGTGVAGNAFYPSSLSGTISVNVTYDINGCMGNSTLQIGILDDTDPMCSGGGPCASVAIVPDPESATCTNSDGNIVFEINPMISSGLVIKIDGTSSTNLSITRTIYNDVTFNALPVGTYDYTIEYGSTACIKTGQVTVDQSGTVAAPVASNVIRPVCAGSSTGSLTLSVPGEAGNVLEWSLDGGISDPFKPFIAGGQITGIPAGPAPTFEQVISVRRNISDPCFASVTVDMTEQNSLISATFNITPATCNGNDGAITDIVASGGSGSPYTFSIDGGQSFQTETAFNGLTGSSYTVRVKDGAGCENDFAANVTFPGYINVAISKNNADCSNQGSSGQISVVVTDPGTFQVALSTDQFNAPAEEVYETYSDPSATFSTLPRGQYFVYVKSNTSGCPTRSAPIDIFGVYDIDFGIEPYCEDTGLSITLTNVTGEAGGAPLEIQVSKKLANDPPEIIYQQFPLDGEIFLANDQYAFLQTPGEYLIKIIQFQNEAICDQSSDIRPFTVPTPMNARVGSVSESYPDIPTGGLQVAGFSGGVNPYDVRITLDSAASFTLPSFETNYQEAGLNNSQQFEMVYERIPAGRYAVEVIDSLGCHIEFIARVPMDRGLFIPTVFTPNGDGSNDVFFIRNLPESSSNHLMISNRWGKEVFVSENYQNNWNAEGTADGIYFYRLMVGESQPLTGWMEIIRGPKP